MPEGSWKCEKCNNINYPFRTKCNRQNCGADKPAESKKSLSPTTEENEQVCCVIHFFCAPACCSKLLFLSIIFVHIKNSIRNKLHKQSMVSLQNITFPPLFSLPPQFLLSSCWLDLAKHLVNCLLFFSFSSIDLQLSTVPVSTRTCLRVEKVQGFLPALLNMGVWKSVLSSSCCSGCRVTLPSHDSCQLVVLNLMVFVVFMDPLIHKVSASLFWQDSTGWFWFLLVRLCTFGNQLICSSLLPLNFRYVSGFWTTLVFIWFWIVYIALKHHRHRDASFIFWSSQLAHHRSHAIYKMGAGKCVW